MLSETTRATAQDGALKLAVCYLLRQGNPDRLFTAFLKSLHRYPAGMPYRAILIQKGFAPGFVHAQAQSWPTADGQSPEIFDVSDEGYDLTAYRKAAQAIDAPMFLFLNSYSRVLAANWLNKLYSAAESLGPNALIGATGSWEGLGEHTAFPNVAIRSNAFLISRNNFLAFPHSLNTKRDCNLFEAGPDSMTKRIQAQGGRIAIVDRDGRIVPPEDWPQARVFRSGNQEKLLIADNRTMDYQSVSLRRRRRRARLAFGDQALIQSQNFMSRWWYALSWRLGR